MIVNQRCLKLLTILRPALVEEVVALPPLSFSSSFSSELPLLPVPELLGPLLPPPPLASPSSFSFSSEHTLSLHDTHAYNRDREQLAHPQMSTHQPMQALDESVAAPPNHDARVLPKSPRRPRHSRSSASTPHRAPATPAYGRGVSARRNEAKSRTAVSERRMGLSNLRATRHAHGRPPTTSTQQHPFFSPPPLKPVSRLLPGVAVIFVLMSCAIIKNAVSTKEPVFADVSRKGMLC